MTEYNPDNYVFFWGGFLSNFYSCSFTVEGITYKCSEQYFMKKKQETFDPGNKELSENILKETNPKKIKMYGRKVKNYDEIKWNNLRYNIMKQGIYEKFSQNKELKELLLSTGDKIIVEASPYDKIWGIGMNIKTAIITHPDKWLGKNLLGKALMEVRTALQN